MTPAKDVVEAYFTIYKGLPFYKKILFNAPTGALVNMTGWVGRMVLKADLDAVEELFIFSHDPENGEGEIVLAKGYLELKGPTAEESALLEWTQAVGHLVLGATPESISLVNLFGFNVKPSTTDVPSA